MKFSRARRTSDLEIIQKRYDGTIDILNGFRKETCIKRGRWPWTKITYFSSTRGLHGSHPPSLFRKSSLSLLLISSHVPHLLLIVFVTSDFVRKDDFNLALERIITKIRRVHQKKIYNKL